MKQSSQKIQSSQPKKNRSTIYNVSDYSIGIVALCGLLLTYWVYTMDHRLPTPLQRIDQDQHPESFIAENAQEWLRNLVKIGPRVVGTNENEIETVAFLREEISKLISQSNPMHKIELDIQQVSGTYLLELKPVGITNVYQNMQNVVVKLSSNNVNSNDSLLLNCHFDSVPLSEGASDNGINCAVLLEILRVLSQTAVPLPNNVILLFNGAEENPLQAAHGFITKHRWFPEVRAVINLEAGGSGGRALLFQSGPHHPWLLNHYAQSALHPHAQALAEEIFQSNLIPSDTDFRLFRDFGKIPGLDIAFRSNGYVYHTKYDKFDIIPAGSYQHMGDNILALTRSLINSEEIKNPELYSHGQMVFYDILGLFLISYSKTIGSLINLGACLFGLLIIYLSLKFLRQGKSKFVVLSAGFQLMGWLLGISLCVTIAISLDRLGMSMSWYGKPWLILGLYCCPVLFGMILPLTYWNHSQAKQNSNIGLNIQTQLHLHGNNLCWILILWFLNLLGIRSSYIVLVNVLLATLPAAIILLARIHHSVRAWLWTYLVFTTCSATIGIYTTISNLTVFIPITGRMGASANSELLIAIISGGFTVLTTSSFIPLVLLLKKPARALYFTALVITLTLAAIILTPVGFPYKSDERFPAPQRFFIYHTERTFYNELGEVRKEDSGFFMWNLDRNSPKSLEKYVPEISNLRCLGLSCDNEMFCGIPIFKSRIKKLCDESVWIPAEKPKFVTPTDLQLISAVDTPKTKKLTFNLAGPDHMNIVICPKLGTNLKSWSFLDTVPVTSIHWDNRPVYFITLSYGKLTEQLRFWVELETTDQTTPKVEIAITGHYMYHDKLFTKTFEQFLQQFPKWTHVTPFLSSYKLWVF